LRALLSAANTPPVFEFAGINCKSFSPSLAREGVNSDSLPGFIEISPQT